MEEVLVVAIQITEEIDEAIKEIIHIQIQL